MALKPHLIGGAWVEGTDAQDDINPSDLSDVVGTYARADRALAEQAIAAAKAAFPAWSRSTPQQRFDLLDAVGDEILKRRQELGELLSREEGKPLADGVGEAGRAGQIFKFFAGEALRLAGERVPSIRPGSRGRRLPRAAGRGRADHALELPARDPRLEDRAGARLRQHGRAQARRPGARLRLGDRGHPAKARRARGRVQPGHGARLGGRRGDPRLARCRCGELHRLARDRPAHRAEMRRAPGQVPARDGQQEPARGARRRRPVRRGELRAQWRLLPDRAALHRVLAPDRHRADPRPLRRGDDRRHEAAQGRPCAQARHSDRAGGRPEPARTGPALPRARPAGRRQARLRRRAAEARDRRLLPAARADHRDHQPDADQPARRCSARSPR